ncbi:hypothetical protein HMPREF1162_0301 [ [[Propionibacterium] namnetense SK182B-JCVI]|uniref:Uncharacterized protein n=1 Tax=[Propionibacterium] namnetense SK182B-JCVI TaxID=1051006 RepID=F9NTD3_9ACTN|nr:hypothetical protein HMPREF1162_0301 [ [[Propionibacterium] namnetense SK182B-JCVI]
MTLASLWYGPKRTPEESKSTLVGLTVVVLVCWHDDSSLVRSTHGSAISAIPLRYLPAASSLRSRCEHVGSGHRVTAHAPGNCGGSG